MIINITVLNVLDVSPLELSEWIGANVLSIRVPEPGPNHTLNVQTDILPIIARIANLEAVVTEFYIMVVGATPTATSVRTSKDDTEKKITSEILGRKKDILYRTLQTMEALRESASRMISGLNHGRQQFG